MRLLNSLDFFREKREESSWVADPVSSNGINKDIVALV